MEEIYKVVENLPSSAGVYQYYDEEGKLLYIGKAKNLKNRVRSYFRFTPNFRINDKLNYRIVKMLSEAVNINYITVKNEFDALVLENSLIKQLNPKYNILLRDDKTYPYLYIDNSLPFARIEITRKIFKDRKHIKYYGPFTNGVNDILKSLYDIFPLVQQKNCLNSKKECLYYHIDMCKAPCVNKISSSEYKKILTSAIYALQNRKSLTDKLELKMKNYSQNENFEKAIELRDRIRVVKKVSFDISTDLKSSESFDVIKVVVNDSRAVVVRMFFRDGKLISSDHENIKVGDSFDLDELYERAIVNMYLNKSYIIPHTILVGYPFKGLELTKSLLSKYFGKFIDIIMPQIGKKKDLLDMCEHNGKEILKVKVDDRKDLVKSEIKELLNLSRDPYSIEGVDNSHLAGSAPVGAVVSFVGDEFYKKGYRQYHLKSLDEYEQMRETLVKRAEHFSNDSPPDLFILDGGVTLLNLAISIFKSYGIGSDVIAISKEKVDFKAYRAKGSARDIIHTSQNSFRLEPSDKRLQFIQRIRDESHRFAITFHKKTKIKLDSYSHLLSTDGIGKAKVKKLIDYFGSFSNIKDSSIDELSMIVSSKDAKAILEKLNKN